MAKRKICIVTGTRAEYGLLYWLMREFQADSSLELQVIATGMHLDQAFGSTYRDIEKDGFTISAKVDLELSRGNDPVHVAHSMGLGVIGFGKELSRLKPDLLVVLGDRFEILSAAQAAMLARIPIAHLHGGEATEGLIDEAIRHSVTKMAQFHFVAAEPYRKRVIQMGEDPAKVFNFGAPALDSVSRLKLLEKAVLEKELGFDLGSQSFMVTYHPVTLANQSPRTAMENLFRALDQFPQARVIFTKANADPGGNAINDLIDAYAAKNSERVRAFTSLGQTKYFSALKQVSLVLGNSSSGLLEVPFFHKATVNIGDRQRGRLRADSVIDCAEEEGAIRAAIKKALSSEFQAVVKKSISPYAGNNPSRKIYETLKNAELEDVLMKKFFDLPVNQ